MKRLIIVVMGIIMCSTALFAGDDDILAKAGSKVLTVGDFESLVQYYSVERKTDLSKDEKFKKDLLNIIANRMALADMARKKGIEKRRQIVQLTELNVNGVLAAGLITQEVTNKIEVTEEDMRLYYKTHSEEFKAPEMVRARHILIRVDNSASEEDKNKAKEKAEGLLSRIRNGEDFAKLAEDFSDDQGSKARGGDLGFFPKSKKVTPFEEAAFSLKPGEVSGIIKTPFGYHIIKTEEKTEAGTKPYDSVKENIREKVFQMIKGSMTKELEAKAAQEAGLEVHPELIK